MGDPLPPEDDIPTHDLLAACEAAGWRFRRPTTNAVTATWASHHTYVSNVAGVDDATLAAAGGAHGQLLRVTRVVPPSGATGDATGAAVFQAAVLTYSRVGDAQRAQRALDGAPPLPGGVSSRPLVARLSQLESPLASASLPSREPPPPGPPAHTSAAELGVPGVTLLLDFVTEAEEAALLRHVDRPDAQWEQLARRRVLHEGYRFDYHTRHADRGRPLGAFGPPVAALAERLAAAVRDHAVRDHVVDGDPCCVQGCGAECPLFDQLTVNEYADTAGIAPHVDTHSAFAPVMCSLSLAGTCAMEFRRDGHARRCLFLPRRSLLVLGGEARYGWSHGIPTRAADVVLCQQQQQQRHPDGGVGGMPTVVVPRGARRVSLTFRRLTPEGHVCRCAWPDDCDSRRPDADAHARGVTASSVPPVAQQQDGPRGVPALEVHHVWDLYERIAPHFSATRFAVWPAVRRFLRSLPPCCLLLDAGCGNGKYVTPALEAGHSVVGCDVATALLRQCCALPTRHAHPGPGPVGAFFRADVACDDLLPVRAGVFDAVLCVAVLHHVSSLERRRNVMRGVRAALRPGGRAIITAWATQQMEPERTLRKWRPIDEPLQKGDDCATTDAPAAGQEYFVPWHVPMHRPEAGAAVKHAAGGGSGEAAGDGTALPVVDAAKNTVVYQRYVHLFAPGELARLAQDVPGWHVEEEFYDSSNWVIVVHVPG